nr:unnamed protein product [Callosobruchus analis]
MDEKERKVGWARNDGINGLQPKKNLRSSSVSPHRPQERSHGTNCVSSVCIEYGIKVARAIAPDTGISTVPKSKDIYWKISLLKAKTFTLHTFTLPSERKIRAIIRGIVASITKQQIK